MALVYTGTAPLDDYNYRVKPTYFIHDTLSFQLTVQGAQAEGQTWKANSWIGTVTLNSPYYPTGNCVAVTLKASVVSPRYRGTGGTLIR